MKSGDRVNVYNHTMGGKRVLEGDATLIAIINDDTDFPEHRIWSVHFKGDAKGDNYNRRQNQMEVI